METATKAIENETCARAAAAQPNLSQSKCRRPGWPKSCDCAFLGYDHLLFVFALITLINDLWMLTKTITAFTLAHSITLVGASLGYFSLLSSPWRPRSRSASPS
jgi:hypothetical protein